MSKTFLYYPSPIIGLLLPVTAVSPVVSGLQSYQIIDSPFTRASLRLASQPFTNDGGGVLSFACPPLLEALDENYNYSHLCGAYCAIDFNYNCHISYYENEIKDFLNEK